MKKVLKLGGICGGGFFRDEFVDIKVFGGDQPLLTSVIAGEGISFTADELISRLHVAEPLSKGLLVEL